MQIRDINHKTDSSRCRKTPETSAPDGRRRPLVPLWGPRRPPVYQYWSHRHDWAPAERTGCVSVEAEGKGHMSNYDLNFYPSDRDGLSLFLSFFFVSRHNVCEACSSSSRLRPEKVLRSVLFRSAGIISAKVTLWMSSLYASAHLRPPGLLFCTWISRILWGVITRIKLYRRQKKRSQ